MRSHRELVDKYLAIIVLEHFHSQHPNNTAFRRYPLGDVLCLGCLTFCYPGGRRDDHRTDSAILTGLHQGPARPVSRGSPRAQLRKLASERDQLLEQYVSSFEPITQVIPGMDNSHAFAVVSSNWKFRYTGKTSDTLNTLIALLVDDSPARLRNTQSG